MPRLIGQIRSGDMYMLFGAILAPKNRCTLRSQRYPLQSPEIELETDLATLFTGLALDPITHRRKREFRQIRPDPTFWTLCSQGKYLFSAILNSGLLTRCAQPRGLFTRSLRSFRNLATNSSLNAKEQ
jgi:hypothetical protein